MNLALIDLNLLVVFDAFMRERNVTRAGKRLGLTQSAMSNALNRLRHLVKDDLFVRGPGGMMPTTRALELGPVLRQAMNIVETAFDPVVFNPSTATQTFNLSMADYVASLILPRLMSRLEEVAPNVDIRVRHNDYVSGFDFLDANEVDFIVGAIVGGDPGYPERFRSLPLFTETYVCVMRNDHPLAGHNITLDEFVAANHLLVTITGEATGIADRMLEKRGLKRRIPMTCNHFLVAPLIIEHSDLIITLAKRMAERFTNINNLRVMPVPMELDSVEITLLWHGREHDHPAYVWMRGLLVDICKDI